MIKTHRSVWHRHQHKKLLQVLLLLNCWERIIDIRQNLDTMARFDRLLKGNLLLIGHGDPTFGSWRWQNTTEETMIRNIISELHKSSRRSKNIQGEFTIDVSSWKTDQLPMAGYGRILEIIMELVRMY